MTNKTTNTMTLVSHKTTVSDVEQQTQGGDNVVSESKSLLISVENCVRELHNDLDHGVSEPWYIKQQLDKLNYYFGLYKTAVFEENIDPSKGIQLVRDE